MTDTALDTERALLGALVLDPGNIAAVRAQVQPEDFGSSANELIFRAILRVADSGHALDLVTLKVMLGAMRALDRVGGNEGLTEAVGGLDYLPSNVESYVKVVLAARDRRRLMSAVREAGAALDRGVDPGRVAGMVAAAAPMPEVSASPDGPVMVCMADVAPERLRWLWPGRIPAGKLTTLAGDPKLGKSVLTIGIAAAVSRGLAWQDRSGVAELGSVILLSAEDDRGDTIRPRLDAAGADVTKIQLMSAVRQAGKDRHPSLGDDLPALRAALASVTDCRLVVIDPVTAYLGGTDSHVNAEVRGVLAPLAALAAETGVAVVLVAHLNKGGGGKALYRVSGSLAFTAAARANHVVVADPEEKGRVLFLPSGGNLGPDSSGMAYRVIGSPGDPAVPVIAWEPDPVDVSAGEAMARDTGEGADSGDRGALTEAMDWLREALAGGPVLAADVQRDARGAGVAAKTLQRAREKLGIKPNKIGGGGWLWALPTGQEGQGGQHPKVGHLGHLGHLASADHCEPVQTNEGEV